MSHIVVAHIIARMSLILTWGSILPNEKVSDSRPKFFGSNPLNLSLNCLPSVSH
jgi:hypothetical protein